MKTTPDERKKLRVLAGIASERSRQDAVILRLLDDIEELENERAAMRKEQAARMLTVLCRDGYCPAVRVLDTCPHGSICERVEAAQWLSWLEGKK